MARTQRPLLPFNLFFFFFFFITLLLFSIYTPISPHIQNNQHFQVLDVSASLEKTFQVLSNEKASPTTVTTTTTSTTLSFPLHPHDSIIKPKYRSYSELITSRLQADSARSNSINFQLQLQHALSNSKYKTNILLPEDLEAPLTLASFGYAALVGVGQPVQKVHLRADTGSDISWLQCQPCECFPQSDPIFNPSESASYRLLSCESQQCTSLSVRNCAVNKTCIYGVNYGDGSRSVGYFATETLSFGNSSSVDNVAIGCALDSRGSFDGLAGILGLGGSAIALPSQIKATSFSYCLVHIDSNSSSTLEFNSSVPADSVLVPIIKNPKFDVYYYVELTGITVADELISIPASVFQIGSDGSGGIIVDLSTTLTLLATQVYNSVRDTFVKYAQNLTSTSGIGTLDTCYDLSSFGSHVSIPTMSFQFSGGKTLSLPPENYFVPVNSNGKFCLAFAGSSTVSIIGNTQQHGFRVTYDLANHLIGFSPKKC